MRYPSSLAAWILFTHALLTVCLPVGAADARDAYGGWPGVPGRPTGFFHTEQIEGVWWLITPDGGGFFSKGVNHVQYNGDFSPKLGQANVETTCLAILGLEAVNRRAMPAVAPVAAPAAHLPNILFILADDLGYGDVGCYNTNSKVPTPNLNRLATQGMRFTDAHAPASVCSPTRYALLTGRYAWRSRLQRGVLAPWDKPLIESGRLTVGSLLQQHGYVSALPTASDKPTDAMKQIIQAQSQGDEG